MNGRISRLCWWCSALGMAAAAAFAGCDESPARTTATAVGARADAGFSNSRSRDQTDTAVDSARAPAEVARLLNKLHGARNYAAMEPHIVPDRRAATIALLRAMDEVFDADARLRETAMRRYGGPHAVAWDLSVLKNNLGIFSAETYVINQAFHGSAATVTLQEGEHVPLVRAPFVQDEAGRWRYAPDLPPAAMAGELRKLAAVIDEIRKGVEGGEDFGPYLDSFHSKLLPQMEAVALATDATPERVTASEARPEHITAAEAEAD